MDPLTHALSGALLVRAVMPFRQQHLKLPLRISVFTGFAAAVFPDLDFSLRLIDTLTYLNWHQGPTHSLLLMPLWGWLLAHLFSRLVRGDYHWRMFYSPICLGLIIHIAGDLITAYGLMLFFPISTERFYLPLVFVIDPWFSTIIIIGLIASWSFPRASVIAVFSLIGLMGYVVMLWLLHDRAINVGREYMKDMALINAEVNVLPQPLSPFHWKIILKKDKTYYIAHINLRENYHKLIYGLDSGLFNKMAAAYQPLSMVNWESRKQFGGELAEYDEVYEAWNHPAFASFRQFSVFPQLDRIDNRNNEVCVWFFDMRFQFPELQPSFRYGMCRQKDVSDWHMRRQRGKFWLD